MRRRPDKSLTHDWIWTAIDTLATRSGLTPSGLARLAGLDPTTFNRSKRLTAEGRPRWPSTESIAKVLQATETALDEFATLQLEKPIGLPFDDVEMSDIAGIEIAAEIRDATVPNWDPAPAQRLAEDGNVVVAPARRRFAVAVSDASLEPAYSMGNVLVVSESAEPRVGDRVLAKPAGMPVLPRLLLATCATHVELGRFSDSTQSLCVRRRDLDWIARIVLVHQ